MSTFSFQLASYMTSGALSFSGCIHSVRCLSNQLDKCVSVSDSFSPFTLYFVSHLPTPKPASLKEMLAEVSRSSLPDAISPNVIS